jgi:hypothetical protein
MIEFLLTVGTLLVGAGLYMWLPEGHKKWGVGLTILGGLTLLYALVLIVRPSSWTQEQDRALTSAPATSLSSPALAPSISPAIFMECHMLALPISIPAHSTLHLIPANKQYMKANHWGFFDVPNDSDKDVQWPDKQTITNRLEQLSKADQANGGQFVYRCEVSNHGPENVLYLGVPLDFNFDGEKPAIRYQPVVPSLDVNGSFVFYVTNDCPESVSVIWQEVATVRTQQHSELHQIKLLRQYRSMVDQIMMLFPSKIQWAGQYSCK